MLGCGTCWQGCNQQEPWLLLPLQTSTAGAVTRAVLWACECQTGRDGQPVHGLCCRNGEAPHGRGQADSDLLRGLHLLHRSVATFVASKLGPTPELPESPIAALAGEPCPGSVCQ